MNEFLKKKIDKSKNTYPTNVNMKSFNLWSLDRNVYFDNSASQQIKNVYLHYSFHSTMLTKSFHTLQFNDVPTVASKSEYEITNYGYGKDHVKILHVTRNGAVHTIKELEVGTKLKLYSQKDYLYGNT
jgi:hypothetical protein